MLTMRAAITSRIEKPTRKVRKRSIAPILPIPPFNLLHALPLELLGHVLKQLDFHSITPLLTAFPELKKYTLTVGRRPPQWEWFFKVDGVKTMSTFPYRLRAQPSLKNQTILLILCELHDLDDAFYDYYRGTSDVMNARHFYVSSKFTLTIYERILRSTQAVFVHLTTSKFFKRRIANIKMKDVLISRGIPVLERIGSPEALMELMPCAVGQFEHSPGLKTAKSVIIRGVHCIQNLELSNVQKLVVEFPEPTSNTEQLLRHINAPHLRELHIRYHTVPPCIQDITLKSAANERRREIRIFSMVDLDTEAWNVVPLPPVDQDRKQQRAYHTICDEIDWSALSDFTLIHISGPTTRQILHSLELHRVRMLLLVETDEQPVLDDRTFRTPSLGTLSFMTRSLSCSAPRVDTRRLTGLYLLSQGDVFHFKDLFGKLGRRLDLLSICVEPPREAGHVDELSSKLLSPCLRSIQHLLINGVPAPFLEDATLEFESLLYVSFTKLPQLGTSGRDCLQLQAFRRATSIQALQVSPDERSKTSWKSLIVKWAPREWTCLCVEGFLMHNVSIWDSRTNAEVIAGASNPCLAGYMRSGYLFMDKNEAESEDQKPTFELYPLMDV